MDCLMKDFIDKVLHKKLSKKFTNVDFKKKTNYSFNKYNKLN